MASLPLVSCFCIAISCRLRGGRQAQHGDGPRLGAGVEADTAARATRARVLRRVITVPVQAIRQAQHLGRAGLDAEATALALLRIHLDLTAIWLCYHVVASSIDNPT